MSAEVSSPEAAVGALPAHVPAGLVRRFDFRHDPAMEVDPWEKFATLNDAPPIFWSSDQGGYWAITRKSIIEEVLARPQIFSSAFNSIPRIDGDLRLIPPNLDPPDHAKYRNIINTRIFNPKVMATIEQDARAIMRELIEKKRNTGAGDFVADFARPFPVAVFLKLMGMPTDRLNEFSGDIDQFFRGEDVEKVGAARLSVFRFAQEWLDSDPGAENAHILRELKAADIEGRPLSGEELTIMVLTLFFAGLDTVTAQMAFIARFLATHPSHRDRLVAEPALIPNAIEEMMRRFGIANLCRLVTQDTELHGVQMKRGDLVMVSSTMAGVDESSYADAMTVDFDRPAIRNHCGFGKGIHACAGQRLARIELVILLEEVLSKFRNFRMAPDAQVRFLPGTIMSMRSLDVVWDAA